MSETEVKYFSPAEAQKTLPLVKKIVKDILETGYQIRTIADSTGGEIEDNPEIQSLVSDMNSYMKELEEIGCYYKDWNFSVGLVDFPAIINGREVFLCWRTDEDDIKYYHGMEEGYVGRKLIPEKYL
jgi:hypothetical protein